MDEIRQKLADYCQKRREAFLSATEHNYFWVEHDRTVYETARDIYQMITGEEFTPQDDEKGTF